MRGVDNLAKEAVWMFASQVEAHLRSLSEHFGRHVTRRSAGSRLNRLGDALRWNELLMVLVLVLVVVVVIIIIIVIIGGMQ